LRTSISKQPGTYLTFDTTKNPTVKAKVGISYVSIENALLNLRTENGGWDLEAVSRRARATWNELLNRITVSGGSQEQNEIFYTALYHALLGPNLFSDVNGEYMGFDRLVHTARGYNHYTNISDWDTYRSQVQLQALLAPRETGDMVQSLLVDADQSGWLPKWPLANDVAAAMNGDNPVPLIATAHAFGARRFDRRAALAYMLKGATQPGTGIHGYKERPRLEEYLQNGYVPFSTYGFDSAAVNSASATLEYVTDDFCIAQFAKEVGDLKTHAEFMRRAQNWQKLFDAEIGFIRPRRADGTFIAGFDPDKVQPKSEVPWERLNQAGFQEGNTWQYTWMIPFNHEGLFSAIGGDQEVVRRLDLFFTELTGWGKPYFNIANEPSFVSPYAYTFAGAPARTQATVQRIMAEAFNATPGGLPGNDDMGATSAWYIWSAIGLYPAIPGVGGFVIGSPSFPAITIETGDGRHVNITSNRSDKSLFVRSATLNGTPYPRSWLPIDAVGPGTTSLEFLLSEKPDSSWATNRADRPPSFSDGQAPAIAFINGTDDLQVEPGGSVRFSLGIRKLVPGPLRVQWVASVPPGLELRPSSGSIRVDGDGAPTIDAQLVASPRATRGSHTITIRLKGAPLQLRGSATLPQITLGVRTGAEEQAEKP
jgi:predicted alpha-1,2-mannosidase